MSSDIFEFPFFICERLGNCFNLLDIINDAASLASDGDEKVA